MVRLVDNDGSQLGIVKIEDALIKARALKLDLVEIQSKCTPPVVKIMDYGKFKFITSKKISIQKKKNKEIKIKEVKFRLNTGNNDYLTKIKNIKGFLFNGNKVKITICFKGREIVYREIGLELIKNIFTDLNNIFKVDAEPKMEGKNIITILNPKRIINKE